MNEQSKRLRQSNIELLRCLLMYMIVVLHFVAHNLLDANNSAHLGDSNFLTGSALLSITCCAVNCFIIISGYFHIKLSLHKIVAFLIPIMFYEFILSLATYGLHHRIGFTPFNYWFVKPFFVLMLLSPIINKGLESLKQNEIIVILALFCIFLIFPFSSITGNSGKNVSIFIFLYIIGHYIREYAKTNIHLPLTISCFIGSVLLIFGETILLERFGMGMGSATMSYNYDNLFVVISAISLFLIFKNIKVNSKNINSIAKSSFYVYIITENVSVYIKPNSIYDCLKVDSWNVSPFYILLIMGFSFIIFCTCIFIDKIRLLLLGGVEEYIVTAAKKINNMIETYENK